MGQYQHEHLDLKNTMLELAQILKSLYPFMSLAKNIPNFLWNNRHRKSYFCKKFDRVKWLQAHI